MILKPTASPRLAAVHYAGSRFEEIVNSAEELPGGIASAYLAIYVVEYSMSLSVFYKCFWVGYGFTRDNHGHKKNGL